MRNPDWVRDEVILALDLYFRAGRKQLPPSHPDVTSLSELLRALPFHSGVELGQNFRNPNGISMILGNFLGIDPDHQTPGLSRNNSLHQAVWDDFASDLSNLRGTAEAIRIVAERGEVRLGATIALAEDELFPEGELLTRLHVARERNRDLVERKKQETLSATGHLACEACDFDFAATYGHLGEGFAECHHLLPLAALPQPRTSRLSDLAVVCANCHRMLHKSRPLLAVAELRSLLAQRRCSSSELGSSA